MRLDRLVLSIHFFLLDSVVPITRSSTEAADKDTENVVVLLNLISKIALAVVIAFFIFGVLFLLSRLRKARLNKPESEIGMIQEMTREEMRLLAEKELEKRGIKPGDKDVFDGPLDWDDVDEKFQPRPRVTRSDLSRDVTAAQGEETDENEVPSSTQDDEPLAPPPELLE